jgi:hypothetical protein
MYSSNSIVVLILIAVVVLVVVGLVYVSETRKPVIVSNTRAPVRGAASARGNRVVAARPTRPAARPTRPAARPTRPSPARSAPVRAPAARSAPARSAPVARSAPARAAAPAPAPARAAAPAAAPAPARAAAPAPAPAPASSNPLSNLATFSSNLPINSSPQSVPAPSPVSSNPVVVNSFSSVDYLSPIDNSSVDNSKPILVQGCSGNNCSNNGGSSVQVSEILRIGTNTNLNTYQLGEVEQINDRSNNYRFNKF